MSFFRKLCIPLGSLLSVALSCMQIKHYYSILCSSEIQLPVPKFVHLSSTMGFAIVIAYPILHKQDFTISIKGNRRETEGTGEGTEGNRRIVEEYHFVRSYLRDFRNGRKGESAIWKW